MNKMKKYTVIFYSLFLVFLFSCEKKVKLKKEKSKNQKQIHKCDKKELILRSELNLFQPENQNLDSVLIKMNQDYPYFFKDHLVDSFKEIAVDENYNIIFDSVFVQFKDIDSLSNLINNAFCVLENYFPLSKPRVVTMIQDDIVDTFEPPFNPIAYDYEENLILIQLQWFLGENHVFYTDRAQPIPEYLTERYNKIYIPPMIFHALGSYYCNTNNSNSKLLTTILNKAKPYFFTELMLPEFNDSLIFGSTQGDIDFFNENEEVFWKYILENQFLFSSESVLQQNFISPAKTTQLGTPGRFGVWIGWQILRSYFNNNDVTMQEVLKETNYLEILNKSNYKP